MKKRIILFGSLLAVFLMVMIPNISAVEYQTVKEIYDNKNDAVQSTLGFLFNKIDLLTSISNFLIILTEILQGFFMAGIYILSLTLLDSIENSVIGLIIYIILMNITAFILHKWDESISKNYELTKIQEIISEFGEYVVFSIIETIYVYLIVNDNFSKKYCN